MNATGPGTVIKTRIAYSSVLPSSRREKQPGVGRSIGTEGIEEKRSHFWRLAGDSAALPRRLRVAGCAPPNRFASQVRNFFAVFFGQEPVEGAF